MTTASGGPLDHLRLLALRQDDFLTTIGRVDPRTPVPWCGRWRVRDLVVHVARIHHWAAAQARRERETPLGRGPFDLEELYGRCAQELRDTLAALPADAPAWTLDGPGPAVFWHRRQLHETVVHLWDLRTAGGLPLDVEPVVWADTVDEVVTVMQPRQVRLGRMAPLSTRVRLVAHDAAGTEGATRRWALTHDDGVADAPDVEVAGPAEAVALLLWGRATPDDRRLTVTGDRDALDAVLAQPLTP